MCGMVSAAEISEIAGQTLVIDTESDAGTNACHFKNPDGSAFPRIELQVDWGNGAAAMAGAGMLGRIEPGMTDPLAGLGDQATAIGPAFFVRVGDDFVNIMIMGLEDSGAAAKRILSIMRPRMGASAQAKSGEESTADESAAAMARALTGILGQAGEAANQASAALSDAGSEATSNSQAASGSRTSISASADEANYGPATGPRIDVPLVAGLTLIGAEHEAGRGDYEPIVTVSKVTAEGVATVFSANLPEGNRVVVNRDVRAEDLRSARAILSWYQDGDPNVFDGTTAFGISSAVYNDLKTKGHARLDRMSQPDNPLLALATALGGEGGESITRHNGTLQRVEPHAVAFPVLLNDEAVTLHAIHARGIFDDATLDFHFLDDANNPLLLRVAGANVGRIVRIAFPVKAAPIEKQLQDKQRVVLHGIYFDFGKDTLRPESEPVLKEIAAALAHNPGWKLGIEGHTDAVGGDSANLELSKRRAEAVKQALVQRYRISAASLTPTGFGATRPAASNETMSGRAQNRRVELVRQ
jgi:outer membrane protein OmpA-like peptidoglycan-associated protein